MHNGFYFMTHSQGKKVIAYEEGGSNGKRGNDVRSTVALLQLSSQKDSLVEAYCLVLFEPSPQSSLCISTDILGASLFLPNIFVERSDLSLPLVVVVSRSELSNADFSVDVITVIKCSDGSLMKGVSLVKLPLPNIFPCNESIEKPSLVVDPSPLFLCLCCNDRIAFVHRVTGTIILYKYADADHSLSFINTFCLNAFVADATIRSTSVSSMEAIEITVLLYGSDNTKSGLVTYITM